MTTNQQWQGTISIGTPTFRLEDTNTYMAVTLARAVEKCLSEMGVNVSYAELGRDTNGEKWTIYMGATGRSVAPVCTIFVGSVNPVTQESMGGR